jgi:phage shock protein A
MSATQSIEHSFKTLESFLSKCRHNVAQSVSCEKMIERQLELNKDMDADVAQAFRRENSSWRPEAGYRSHSAARAREERRRNQQMVETWTYRAQMVSDLGDEVLAEPVSARKLTHELRVLHIDKSLQLLTTSFGCCI